MRRKILRLYFCWTHIISLFFPNILNGVRPVETQDFASLLLLAEDVMLELTLSADADRRIFNEIRSLSDRHKYEIWIKYNDRLGTG